MDKLTITICIGSSCHLKGSRQVVEKLQELVSKYDILKETRGLGLMRALEFNVPVSPYVSKALEKGLVIISAGTHIVRFVPPLVITKENVDEMISILESCLAESM